MVPSHVTVVNFHAPLVSSDVYLGCAAQEIFLSACDSDSRSRGFVKIRRTGFEGFFMASFRPAMLLPVVDHLNAAATLRNPV